MSDAKVRLSSASTATFRLKLGDIDIEREIVRADFESWIADDIARIARERVPVLAEATIDRQGSWAGLYEMTPDHLPLLGFSGEVENLFLACGCSGHGVMFSPALGQLGAELLAGRTPSLDVEALRPDRFRKGKAAPGAALL